MEQMPQPYLNLVENCINFARKFLLLPEKINIFFDDCPSERFPTSVNAAESDDKGNLWFNKVWFTEEDRWNNHKVDIEFFVFHELRHMHQFCSISNYLNGKNVSEDSETIEKWKADFSDYKRNTGGESEDENLMQEVEIDANAYAALLAKLYHLGDGAEMRFSVPQEAQEIAFKRFNAYQKKPEIQSFLNAIQAKNQKAVPTNKQAPVRVIKIGRNEPCPCGSGLKYKKCTCEEYHK